ncbi:MAG: nucleotidyl transferase AbiEii/AbiGii toxin family protein [Candidatus Krumholzibacteriia bacterium]
MAAAVPQRLLDLALQTGRPFGELLQSYALERWLYRLAQSEHRERFTLRGALMLATAGLPVSRPTRDIDLLAGPGVGRAGVRPAVGAICAQPVPDDGLAFDPGSVRLSQMTGDDDHEGVRARFRGRLGTTSLAMQVDVGFGDVITPGPVELEYPALLDLPAPWLRVANRETAVAEKFETMVRLGERDGRLQDFCDLWLLARHGAFDGRVLGEAVAATCGRRGTAPAAEPAGLTARFAGEPERQAAWSAYLRRSRLAGECGGLDEVVALLRAFLGTVAGALAEGRAHDAHWPAGGPWQTGRTDT